MAPIEISGTARRSRPSLSGRAGIALAALLVCLPASPANPPRRPSFIIFLVDMLRPDHLGLYGYHKNTSPTLDLLAREGIVFDNAHAPAPWTLPSTVSLLTGLLPSEHGATQRTVDEETREVTFPADPEVWLPRKFREHGYATVAFHTHPYLRRSVSNIHEAFQEYHYPTERYVRTGKLTQGTAHWTRYMYLETLYPPFEDWLVEHREKDFLAYLHVIDVHGPYSEVRLLDEDRESVERGLESGRIEFSRMADVPMYRSTDHRDPNKSYLYDGHVRHVDDFLRKLQRKLEELGIAEDTFVVFTADHGEGFGEHHGYWGHGRYLYDTQSRVPLVILSHREVRENPRRIVSHVNTVGLLPTLAELAGIPLEESYRSRSFHRLLRAPAEPADWEYLSVSETALRGAFDAITLDGRFKLITDLESGERELFDLREDPGERSPLPLDGLRGRVKRRFDELVAARRALRETAVARESETRQLDEGTSNALRALGYLQ